MINTDYDIGAIEILLDKSCISERYFPLIAHMEQILSGLRALGCGTKSDASKLSDEALSHIGLDGAEIRLFRRFLSMYDPDPHKFKEIESLCHCPEERAAYYEL
ncbi:MAG: hypothetical protein KBT31_06220 [Firmicutes bacterium]|nr:hypothetical protein [Candidatus Colimorpha enterica]